PGTLTEGKPKVVAVVPAETLDETEVLRLAASLERASEHPLARAIVDAAAERKIAFAAVVGFDAPAGIGVVGTVEGRRLALGNARFLAELKISTAGLESEAENMRRDGVAVVFLGVGGKVVGI